MLLIITYQSKFVNKKSNCIHYKQIDFLTFQCYTYFIKLIVKINLKYYLEVIIYEIRL